jgi:hypothetical protein
MREHFLFGILGQPCTKALISSEQQAGKCLYPRGETWEKRGWVGEAKPE